MKYYLAIDVGTTNWKAAVYDQVGKLIAIERVATKTHLDASGYSYYNPIEMWDDISKLCKAVTAKVAQPISAVSVTSIAEAVVGVDKNGKVLGDIIAWFDTRSIKEAEELREKLTAEKLYEITGLDVNPIFSLPKIMWIRKHWPEVYQNAYKWLQMGDYMLFCLTGECVTDYTFASRTLAFDVVANEWSREILDMVDVPVDMLPRVCQSGTTIGTISSAVAELTGITAGAKVVVGGNDHPCASIAAGAIRGDKILDSSGTAESFIYISKKDAVPNMTFEGQRTCRYLQKDRYALWGGIICSGRSFDWAYEILTSSECFGIKQDEYSYAQILAQLENEKGAEKGLLFYPHMRGAGAPYWNPKASGSFVGLRDTHSAKNMLRSVLEGLSMQARMIVDMEEKLAGVNVESLCVVGGSSHNKVWQTIKASVTNKDIELCFEAEATSQGAAMLAAIGDGMYKDIEEVSEMLASKNIIIHPDPKMVPIYDEIYQIYKEGYESMKNFNTQLYNIQEKFRG
ncbi:FGGY-family carbohydrate kinase [Candidatus Epulonipiscium viviparus]|uniref:FGGY-family carbohydrate kinase n=1 Tax=Candidatus Epulonipiscium viviparus TaxID=420336 RepID=UPI00016C0A20|nr:FGGY-family carbohydrate kinase [Candidatus Epulopiscium viviparus]